MQDQRASTNHGTQAFWPGLGCALHAEALWTCDAAGRLLSMNPSAETLLGCSAKDMAGRSWRAFMAGIDRSGLAVFQDENCPIVRRIRLGEGLARWEQKLTAGRHAGRWIEVLPIPLRRPGEEGTAILFCARAVGPQERLRSYVLRIASRSGEVHQCDWLLTRREEEILELLSTDLDSHAVARLLGVSYSTVRNHIRNILEKMNVHSIQEGIARYLLKDSLENSA